MNITEDMMLKADEDENIGTPASSDLFKSFMTEKKTSIKNIYLSEEVHSNFGYAKLLHEIRTAEEPIAIYLSSYGGYCSAGYQIVNAIRDCPQLVTMIVDAPCYSMGAVLAVSGNALIMKSNTFLMFHNYSGGFYGKGGELMTGAAAKNQWLTKATTNVCAPFLSKKEISGLEKDQDVYVHWDDGDLEERLRRHFPAMKAILPLTKRIVK